MSSLHLLASHRPARLAVGVNEAPHRPSPEDRPEPRQQNEPWSAVDRPRFHPKRRASVPLAPPVDLQRAASSQITRRVKPPSFIDATFDVRSPFDSGFELRFVQTSRLTNFLSGHMMTKDTALVFDIDQTLLHNSVEDPPQLTESRIPALIAKLQNEGVPIFALTAQGPYRKATILHALRQVNIDLRRTSPVPENIDLRAPAATWVEGGVVFGYFNSKGSVLARVLRYSHLREIVFIDDQVPNFWSLARTASLEDIKLTAVHYTGALLDHGQSQDDAWQLLMERAEDRDFAQAQAISAIEEGSRKYALRRQQALSTRATQDA